MYFVSAVVDTLTPLSDAYIRSLHGAIGVTVGVDTAREVCPWSVARPNTGP